LALCLKIVESDCLTTSERKSASTVTYCQYAIEFSSALPASSIGRRQPNTEAFNWWRSSRPRRLRSTSEKMCTAVPRTHNTLTTEVLLLLTHMSVEQSPAGFASAGPQLRTV